MENIDNFLNKNLAIRIKPPNTPKASFIWNYFGHLYNKSNESVDYERIYCKSCFDQLKNEQPDALFHVIKKQIAIYNAKTGTGNMKNHLLVVHQITEPQQTKTTNQHIISMFSRNRIAKKVPQLKEQLGYQLTFMCCRDLLPFSIVENEGFQDFLIANKVVGTKADIPCRTTLSPNNLNKIFNVCVEKTKSQLKLAPTYATVTCDTWTDKYKHRSYICFTIHFLDFNLQLHEYSLRTDPFDCPHTGEAIKNVFSTVLHEFNLNPNNIIVVSDRGSNMRKAWKLLNVTHTFCVGHGIHNWLMKDCFPNIVIVSELLNKVQMIIDKLRYRQHELEEEFVRLTDQERKDLLLAINQAGEILDADSASSFVELDDSNQSNDTFEYEYDDPQLVSRNSRFSSKSILSTSPNSSDETNFQTLKKRVLTRWNTILIMLRSYALNIPGVEVLLRRLKHLDLVLSPHENQIINDLIEFLSSFESTTKILSASKSYPTMSLCLLLRIEIESMLQITGTESIVIRDMKNLLVMNLDKRFPIDRLKICAFLLDPSQLKIDIDLYLIRNETTKKSLLVDMIKEFKITYVPQSCATQDISITSSSSCTTSTTPLSPSAMKRYLSSEYPNESRYSVKKLRENLIQKHTPISLPNVDPIVGEIENYLKLEVNCDDILKFWQTSGDKYPHLCNLARIVLAIPATSTRSERIFSTTGLILNAKRTMLLPENVGKIQVIHDNYNLLKET